MRKITVFLSGLAAVFCIASTALAHEGWHGGRGGEGWHDRGRISIGFGFYPGYYGGYPCDYGYGYGPGYYYPYYAPYPTVYRGYEVEPPMRGSERSVDASVEESLAHQGYYHGSVDGVIGPQAREAIRAYQRQHGLTVTGTVNTALLRSLDLE